MIQELNFGEPIRGFWKRISAFWRRDSWG